LSISCSITDQPVSRNRALAAQNKLLRQQQSTAQAKSVNENLSILKSGTTSGIQGTRASRPSKAKSLGLIVNINMITAPEAVLTQLKATAKDQSLCQLVLLKVTADLLGS
jgi:hypothetical protein